ncbi:sigma-70 family RNA polymerase sigma factor [Phytoactinopolyspora mesophila]|uniref:Sigma-70 family RNA polymerase sigma factor n=1 Tax=Phytoactinopolyspora mesophila TaxID=2650750 RepID=A0A7K3M758_9ACTN|nr:sigma-70 family RNA polymerase sigma factor [Phytoactinopolyspora mesophila]NDL59163.1 sigma-70 family RNA polymerase sigma factor [Phytoactinopolyspora mesophila]
MEEQPAPIPTDADLVVRARAGDRDAFAAIYDRFADRIHDFCWSMLRNRDDAADATQDTFLRAVERLGQLKEPGKLRSWLYSIARNEALARLRSRQRQVPDESMPDVPDPARGPETRAGENELRQLVWDAAAGLGERDRVLLDLHVRQGLEGAELADAAGVSTSHVYVLLGRLRDQVERSLGALLVARLGRAECTVLDSVLVDWDGRYSALIRKRVARHVDGCDICGERRRTAASPMALLSTVPIMLAPAEVRDVVLAAFGAPTTREDDDHTDGHPGHNGSAPPPSGDRSSAHGSRPGWLRPGRAAVLVSAATALVAGGILAGIVLAGSEDDGAAPTAAMTDTPPHLSPTPSELPTAPGAAHTDAEATPDPPATNAVDNQQPADGQDESSDEANGDGSLEQTPPQANQPGPGELSVSASVLQLGSQQGDGSVGLRNTGESALTYQVTSDSAWLTVDHVNSELGPDASRELRVSADRSALPEGDHRATVQVSSAVGDAAVEVIVAVERPPVIEELSADPAEVGISLCSPDSAQVRARASDESGISGVELSWSGAGGSGAVGMAERAGAWHAQLGPFDSPGPVSWSIMAVDTRGNVATSETRTLTVNPCPQ